MKQAKGTVYHMGEDPWWCAPLLFLFSTYTSYRPGVQPLCWPEWRRSCSTLSLGRALPCTGRSLPCSRSASPRAVLHCSERSSSTARSTAAAMFTAAAAVDPRRTADSLSPWISPRGWNEADEKWGWTREAPASVHKSGTSDPAKAKRKQVPSGYRMFVLHGAPVSPQMRPFSLHQSHGVLVSGQCTNGPLSHSCADTAIAMCPKAAAQTFPPPRKWRRSASTSGRCGSSPAACARACLSNRCACPATTPSASPACSRRRAPNVCTRLLWWPEMAELHEPLADMCCHINTKLGKLGWSHPAAARQHACSRLRVLPRPRPVLAHLVKSSTAGHRSSRTCRMWRKTATGARCGCGMCRSRAQCARPTARPPSRAPRCVDAVTLTVPCLGFHDGQGHLDALGARCAGGRTTWRLS